MIKRKSNLADIIEKVELSAYYDSSKLEVGTLVRDARTCRTSTRRIDFPEYDVILHVSFKEPIEIEDFSHHIARYLRKRIPGCRRLVTEKDTKVNYRLEGRKGSDIRINTLVHYKGRGGVEFSICCNYIDAMDILRDYALKKLGTKRRDLKEYIYIGNSMYRVK